MASIRISLVLYLPGSSHLITKPVPATIVMLIQTLNEHFLPASLLYQTRYIMDYVERVRPFVALRKARRWILMTYQSIPPSNDI